MEVAILFNLLVSLHSVLCRDFYVGMFRRNDFLVAQDNLYRERRPNAFAVAEYGRLFKCPITYFRVTDRLGAGPFPIVRILRGGLRKKYIAVRIRSGFSLPISVNIYVGCENRAPRTPIRPWKVTTPEAATGTGDGTAGDGSQATGGAGDGGAGEPGGEPGGEAGGEPGGEPGGEAEGEGEGEPGAEADAEAEPDAEPEALQGEEEAPADENPEAKRRLPKPARYPYGPPKFNYDFDLAT